MGSIALGVGLILLALAVTPFALLALLLVGGLPGLVLAVLLVLSLMLLGGLFVVGVGRSN